MWQLAWVSATEAMKWNLKTSRGKKILFPQILNERVGEKTELGDGFKRERESEGERKWGKIENCTTPSEQEEYRH